MPAALSLSTAGTIALGSNGASCSDACSDRGMKWIVWAPSDFAAPSLPRRTPRRMGLAGLRVKVAMVSAPAVVAMERTSIKPLAAAVQHVIGRHVIHASIGSPSAFVGMTDAPLSTHGPWRPVGVFVSSAPPLWHAGALSRSKGRARLDEEENRETHQRGRDEITRGQSGKPTGSCAASRLPPRTWRHECR